jgi:hypothetical protein
LKHLSEKEYRHLIKELVSTKHAILIEENTIIHILPTSAGIVSSEAEAARLKLRHSLYTLQQRIDDLDVKIKELENRARTYKVGRMI